MKVAYIGNFREPYCTEVHISKTLNELGVETFELQEDEVTLSNLKKTLEDSDVLLYTRTWGVKEKQGFLDLLKEIEGDIVSASYHLDLYYGIQRQKTLDGDPFWSTEYVFTPDGDPDAQVFFEGRGINHHYIKPGVYKGECGRGNSLDIYSNYDVAFVGSVAGYHSEWPYRQELHNWLKRTYRRKYGKFGHPEKVIRNQELNDFYASVKVVVGDSLCPGFSKPYYWSDRIYETLGRGGLLIHPYIEGLEEEFTDGLDAVFYKFGDFKQLKELIDFYVNSPDSREQIISNSIDKVVNDCTYHNRLQQAFGIMGFEIGV